jgi:methyl-accepting chemotaxis protein
MDEVTQQNSALVEQNAATAKTLEHQSGAMNDRVNVFRIESGAAKTGMPPAAVRRAEPATPKPAVAASRNSRRAAGALVNASARKMQTALAAAVNAEADWQEF